MPSDVDSWYARPVFFVTDCEAALRFYASLGFVEDWRHAEHSGTSCVHLSLRQTADTLQQRTGRRHLRRRRMLVRLRHLSNGL